MGRPAKSPGISGSLQKWGVISRSPGIVKKTPGIEGIRFFKKIAQEMRICVVFKQNVCLYPRISLNVVSKLDFATGDHGKNPATTPPLPTEPRRLLEITGKFCYYPPPTESRRLSEITEKTQEIQQPQLGSSVWALYRYHVLRHNIYVPLFGVASDRPTP